MHSTPMQSTVKPTAVKQKQADDPHDLLDVAPGVAQVAPSDSADPTDEEVSNLLRAAARQRSGAKTNNKPDVAAGPSAPPVDTTFRPSAVNKVRVKADRSSMGKQAIRGVIGFVLALGIVVGVAAWQSYGDAAREMAATWLPQLGLAPSASSQDSAPAAPPSPAGVQAAAVTAAPEQSAQSAPQGVVPATASPVEAPTLQSMAREVATLGQKVEQLQATIEQLRASQDQMSRDVARGAEAKVSDARASEQNLRPRPTPPAPRPAVVPARKPIAAFRPPQGTAAPLPPPSSAYYGQRQPEPLPPTAQQQLADPELSSVPRPPLPLHQ